MKPPRPTRHSSGLPTAAAEFHHWAPGTACRVLVLFIVATMSSPSSAQTPCIPSDPLHTWDWGLGGGSAWAAFGQKGTSLQVITFMRSPTSEALMIYFHNASKALRLGQEIPGFTEWSFESGSGKSTVAIDGVGILQKFQDGQIGMRIGSLSRPDESLSLFSQVSSRVRNELRFIISGTCYAIPVTKAAKVALKIVFSPHPQFNKTALGLNDVRDGKVSLEEFARR